MNYYTLYAFKSISEITVLEEKDETLWTTRVTELAFENDFVLHGLLSVSALHQALSGIQRDKHMVMAIHHHDLGVSLFRPYLSNFAAERIDAIFAFSCLIVLYSFGIQRLSEAVANPITRMIQVLSLIRGTSSIVKIDQAALRRSRWSAMMLPTDFKFTMTLPDAIEEMLAKLRQRSSAMDPADPLADMYMHAIEALRNNLIIAIAYPSAQLNISFLPIHGPAEFWTAASDGEPLALAILANYGVILYWMRKNIWVEGWGIETVEGISQVLPSEWSECIDWAKRETELS